MNTKCVGWVECPFVSDSNRAILLLTRRCPVGAALRKKWPGPRPSSCVLSPLHGWVHYEQATSTATPMANQEIRLAFLV